MNRRISILAVSVSLLAVGCGSNASPAASPTTAPTPATTDAPSPTTPTPTSPSTPATPAPTTPTTDEAPPPTTPELPERPVVVDDGGFGSIGELADTAGHVVVGTVTGEQSLGRPRADVDPESGEYVGLTVTVDSVIKGAPITEVHLGWEAYVVDDSGERIASNVLNGIPVPHVGDQLLLFLRPVDAPFAELLGGFPTHAAVALDGIGFVDGGTVTITDSSSTATAVLAGMRVEDVAALV